ncbi:MAG TPA: PAS domain S-box protein [Smithellaceae bacterium]|nr:PAS domain S-box protein [Smithellaceae bacterium]
MKESSKTKSWLLDEIAALKQRIHILEQTQETRRLPQEGRWASDRRFRSLAETAGDLIWEIDSNGFYTYTSSRVKDLLGYEPEEIIGKTPFDLMRNDEKKRVSALFKDIADSRRSFSGLENINLHKDGHEIIIETSGAPFFDPNGNYMGYCGFDRDITARKQMEEALRASEELYRTALETSNDGVVIIRDSRYMYANQKFLDTIGRSSDEIIGKTMGAYIHPDDLANVMDHTRKYKQGAPVPKNIEIRSVKPDGSIIHMDVSLAAVTYQGEKSVLAYLRDITGRKQVEEALRASEEHYSRLVDTIPDIIIRTDTEGNIQFINDVALQISAYGRDEILGHNMLTFVAPEDRERLTQNAFLMMQNRLGPQEYQLIIKNGTKIPFEANGDVLRNRDGVPFGLVFVCRDIRERKRAAEERYRYEKLHGVLEMAGTVCHELNQPMQIISGYSEMILKNTSENDPLHRKLDKIYTQIHRMGAITNKLMSINDYETKDYAGFSRIIDINREPDKDTP